MERRHPETFKFLCIAGPAVGAIVVGLPMFVATMVQAFPKLEPWATELFWQWWPTVTAGWFVALCVVVIVGFIASLIFTGWQVKSPKSKPSDGGSPPLLVDQDHWGSGHNIVAETVHLGPPAPEIKIIAPIQIINRPDGTFQRYFTFGIESEYPLKTLLVAITGSEILDISFNPLDQGTVNYGEFPRKGDTHLFRLSGPSGRYQVVVNTTDDKSPVEPEFGINQ